MAKVVNNTSKVKTKTSLQKVRSESPNIKKIIRPKKKRLNLALSGKEKGTCLGNYTLGLMKLD